MPSNPSVSSAVVVTSSGRQSRPTPKGLRYRLDMAAQRVQDLLKAKTKIFSQAAVIIVTEGETEGCCKELEQLQSDILEAYETLKTAGEHEVVKDQVTSTVSEVGSMIRYLVDLHAETELGSEEEEEQEQVEEEGGADVDGSKPASSSSDKGEASLATANGEQIRKGKTKSHSNKSKVEASKPAEGPQATLVQPNSAQVPVGQTVVGPQTLPPGLLAVDTQANTSAVSQLSGSAVYMQSAASQPQAHFAGTNLQGAGTYIQGACTYTQGSGTYIQGTNAHTHTVGGNTQSANAAAQLLSNPLLQLSTVTTPAQANTLATQAPAQGNTTHNSGQAQSYQTQGSHRGYAGASAPPIHFAGAHLLSPAVSVISGSSQSVTNDLQVAKLIKKSKMELPKPSIFYGDPIKFTGWARSFHALVVQTGLDSTELFYYLLGHLGGQALELVSQLEMQDSPTLYEDAVDKLRREYGDPIVIANAYKKSLSQLPYVGNSSEKLKQFSITLDTCLTAKNLYASLQILDFTSEINVIVSKLPSYLIGRWNRKVTETYSTQGVTPTFADLCSFVKREADVLNNPVICQLPGNKPKDKKPADKAVVCSTGVSEMGKSKGNSNLGGGKKGASEGKGQGSKGDAASGEKAPPKCLYCGEDHWLDRCSKIMKLELDARHLYIKSNRICFSCLRRGHMASRCKFRLKCRICQKTHATMLHKPSQNTASTRATETAEVSSVDDSESATSCNTKATPVVSLHSRASNHSKCGMIVPVWLFAEEKPQEKTLIYAALDTQSDCSFVTKSVAEQLPVSSVPTNLTLSTMGTIEQVVPSSKVKGLAVQAFKGGEIIKLPSLFTSESMPNDKTHIPTMDKLGQWPHLQFLSDKLVPVQQADIALLLGYDCPAALCPISVVSAGGDKPYAVETKLGWSVVGPVSIEPTYDSHVTMSYPVNSLETGQTLHHSALVYRTSAKEIVTPSQLLAMFDQDFGNDRPSIAEYSQEDVAFLQIMKSGVERVEERYVAPLPFRAEEAPKLPYNEAYAKLRLSKLRQKMQKNPQYKADYIKFMSNILDSNFAESVSDESNDKCWYLCHHGVYNAKKPAKIRIVFDASAKFGGCSLNDHLLTGPDLTNSLVGVLCRFRAESVAVICDIQQMFFQFYVAENHRDYLRFLWFKNNDIDQEVVSYRMRSHIFGASSSPSVSNYCLKQIATDFGHLFDSRAEEFVKRSFYVDDGLISLPSEDELVKVVKDTQALLKKGSLNLHKFVSNSQKVLEKLGVNKDSAPIDLPGYANIERALGLQWCVTSDSFVFRLNLPEKPQTRRGVLAVVSAIFDPLGLISPYVLEGKRIMQAICKASSSWDEPLAPELAQRFHAWVNTLDFLKNVEIPRCVKPSTFQTVVVAELHVFADASTSGYGACAYLRLVDSNSSVHCTLVAAKSRVLPSKSITIPRLELSAAVVAAKLGFMLVEELKSVYSMLSVYYWSDSLVTLGYILNSARKFHTFVANRVQLIQELTKQSAWHHVPTELNPADMASRGLSAIEWQSHSSWFKGPKFLLSADLEPYLRIKFNSNVAASDPEVRPVVLCTRSKQSVFSVDRLSHCKSWSSVIAVVLLCISFFMKIFKTSQFRTALHECLVKDNLHTVQSRELSKLIVFKLIQSQFFAEERKALSAGETVTKHSRLYRLNPFLDKQGIIRVGGRVRSSELSFQAKYPVVLPSSKLCKISQLIVQHFHEASGHQGRSFTINAMKSQGIWVLSSTANVNTVIHNCFHCKRLHGRPQAQIMADLPEVRVKSAPPFSYVGVDIFGPFVVKEGRKSVKRYGVLFICLCSKAVHIEVTCSLSTDAFISTLRRFIALRGKVRALYCDRGTNFIGTQSEFIQAAKELDKDKISQFLSKNSCDYVHFNFHVAHASHFGGIWERYIRSARRILASLLWDQGGQLQDESLRTLMYEVTALINSRPITLDPSSEDLVTPLSPQNLLTAKSGVVLPPPGKFEKEDLYARKYWRRVQFLVNQFWVKWRKEYLNDLQCRQKWAKPQRNVQVGDVVLLKEDSVPRGSWSLCLVDKVYLSTDNRVRSVRLRVGDKNLSKSGKRTKAVSFLERPIHKLVVIVANQSTSNHDN